MFGENAFSGYSVHDIDVALEFYKTTLGLPILEQPGMGFRIELPSGQNVFLYPKPDHTPAEFTVLNFPVGDINGAIAELVGKGVTFEQYDNLPAPQDELGVLRGLSSGYGPDIAWFKDPSGNVLSVLQES